MAEMSRGSVSFETICDTEGQPLHPDSVVLLKALDKLLTVGAYYSTEHEQYLIAARKARDAIVGVIGSRTNHIAIEITAQGMMIGRQNLDPQHRNVRLLHDLLVPLNIARLEIDGTLTPEDLRQALASLHHHRATLGQVNTFQEIVIENLPDSVRAVSCSVLRRSTAESTSGTGGLDELLSAWDESPVAEDSQTPLSETALLSQKFLDLITQIIANLESLGAASGFPMTGDNEQTYVTVEDLVSLKQAMEQLMAANPDPAELALLISQAQRALGLSRDPQSVDLVFRILRKDLAKTDADANPIKPRHAAAVTYKFTVAELQQRVDELANMEAPIPDPGTSSRANQLGLVLHLLRSDPPRTLRTTLIATIEKIIGQPNLAEDDLHLFARAAVSVVEQEDLAIIDELLPVYTGTLRRKRPESVSLFWIDVIAATTTEQLVSVWPHLVNDILLGLSPASRELITSLAVTAGSLPLAAARTAGSRLEKQPALQGKTAARDLLIAPLARIQTVLAVLFTSPLKEWLGEVVFHALRKKPHGNLVDVVISALGDHEPRYNGLYLELIQYEPAQGPSPELREHLARILRDRLTGLPADQRNQEWVPSALTELAGLEPDQARSLLEQVQNEKKFFFFRAWPAGARRTATEALQTATREVN